MIRFVQMRAHTRESPRPDGCAGGYRMRARRSSLPIQSFLINSAAGTTEAYIEICLSVQIGARKFASIRRARLNNRPADGDTGCLQYRGRRIHDDLAFDTRMQRAVVRHCCAGRARFDSETRARVHDARVEAAIIGNNTMQELIGVVNRDCFARLSVNRGRNEDIVLQHTFRNRAGTTA